MNEGIAAGDNPRHGLGIGLVGQRDDPLLGRHAGTGTDQDQMIGVPQGLNGLDQDIDVLLTGVII